MLTDDGFLLARKSIKKIKNNFVLIGKIYIFVISKEKTMAGRPKIYDEETVLEKATEVFWNKGYANASADDLLQAMGIGKGSFYLAFKGGKAELFEKTMNRVVALHFDSLEKAVKECEDPVQLIKDFFYALIGEKSPIGSKGCYFGNALVQLADQDIALQKLAKKHLQRLQMIFTKAMQRGQNMKEIGNDHTAEALGLYLLNLWNGINITKQTKQTKDQLKKLIEMNLKVIK